MKNRYIKQILLVLLLNMLATVHFAWALRQETDVKGKVVNEQQEPIIGASVYLLSSNTEVIIKTGVTDDGGYYEIKNAPQGSFVIEVSAVGLSKFKSEPFTIADKGTEMDVITMLPLSTEIEAVEIKGELPLIQSSNGKLILNVENSSISAGNNALEVLKRAPGVSVDKDDNVLLMGQQGVNVTIDGRQTYMTGDQLATFLKSTDGAQIRSIEVSTTRSAKDDAEGAAGVINIVMKKNKMEGFNGSFVASGGIGKHFRGNSSINLNYKKNNTTLFGNYSYTNNTREDDLEIERTISNKNVNTVSNQKTNLVEDDRTHNYKVGIEQKTSDRNILTLQFNGNNNIEEQDNNSITNFGPNLISIDSILNSVTVSNQTFNRYSLNANNEFKIDTNGTKLTADVDYSMFRTTNHVDYDYRMLNPDQSPLYDPELERNIMPVEIDIFAAKLDFLKTIGKGQLETGVKYSNVNSDNNTQYDLFLNNSWQNDANRSNYFIYKEQIAAGYIDYNTTFGKWNAKVGLRGEYTISDGHSVTKDEQVKRDYLDLFPSGSLSYNAHENHVLALSYARKISRPNYRFLNPFEFYIDKFTFMKGNPYLNPQYTHNITLNYSLYKMFNITLGTDLTTDAMVESMGQDSTKNTTWVIRENLGKSSTSYVNISAPFRIGKFWTMYNNLTGIHMYFEGPIAGSYVKQGSVFFQGASMNTFKLSKAFSAEMSVNYTSPFIYNVYRIETKWNMDVGATYNFKDERSALKLAATDIFKTNRNNLSTNFSEFNSKIRQYNDAQTIRLTYTYKFGNLKQSIRKKDSDSEEKSRAL